MQLHRPFALLSYLGWLSRFSCVAEHSLSPKQLRFRSAIKAASTIILKKQSCPLRLIIFEVFNKAIHKLSWVINSLNASQERNYLCELRTGFVASGIYDITFWHLVVAEPTKHLCNQT